MKTTPDNPSPPKDLSAEAKAEWRRIVTEMSKRGHITRSDRSIMLLYVKMWAVHQAAAAKVAEDGAVIVWEHNGITGANPHYRIMIDTAKVLRRLLADLKLTPATRPEEKQPEPELEALEF